MVLKQFSNRRNQIAGRNAAPLATQTLAGTRMQPDRQMRSRLCTHALGQQGADDTCQHVAQSGTGHRRMAVITERQLALRRGDQGAGALEHDTSGEFVRQAERRLRPVSLDLRTRTAQQPRSLARVRRQHQPGGRPHYSFGQQIECIGVPDLTFVIAAGGNAEQAATPGALPEPRPDHQHVGRLDQRQQLIGRGQAAHHQLRAARQKGAHMHLAGRRTDQPGATAQRALRRQQRGATGPAVATDHQQPTEVALVRITPPRW